MKQIAMFLLLSLAGGIPMSNLMTANAQASATTERVTGKVTDPNGEPLIGVTVTVKGTNRATSTDVDGNYSITAPKGSTLVFSYVGSKTVESKVGNGSVNTTMEPSSTNLDEIVVTALGIKKDKKSLGYAIDDVGAEELMRNKTANPLSSLSGKVAGVNITQSSGAAGAGAQIILRGGTSIS